MRPIRVYALNTHRARLSNGQMRYGDENLRIKMILG